MLRQREEEDDALISAVTEVEWERQDAVDAEVSLSIGNVCPETLEDWRSTVVVDPATGIEHRKQDVINSLNRGRFVQISMVAAECPFQ